MTHDQILAEYLALLENCLTDLTDLAGETLEIIDTITALIDNQKKEPPKCTNRQYSQNSSNS